MIRRRLSQVWTNRSQAVVILASLCQAFFFISTRSIILHSVCFYYDSTVSSSIVITFHSSSGAVMKEKKGGIENIRLARWIKKSHRIVQTVCLFNSSKMYCPSYRCYFSVVRFSLRSQNFSRIRKQYTSGISFSRVINLRVQHFANYICKHRLNVE